jgi:MoaA/NifB/PqqE/SkfB family radical SAM enzyme
MTRKLAVLSSDRPWATRPDGASVRRLPVLSPSRPIDRATRPIYAVWEVTLRCDLACRHCGSRAGKGRPDELTTAEALDLVDQLHDLGVREISLIGGEVYLRDDWTTIARAIVDKGITCGIVTGGRSFDRARAQAAKDAGVGAVSVSVDGLEASHDRLRGASGSFRAALAALEHLEAVGLQRSTNTQINRWNLHDIPAVLEEVAARGIHAWQIQFTVAMARAADHPSMLLQPYQLLEVMPMIARLKARADELGVRIWSGNNVGYYGPYEKLLYEGTTTGHHLSCGAGSSSLGIEANGDIKGCPSLPTADYVAATSATCASCRSGSRARRCASRGTGPRASSGVTARPATTPTSVARAAPGRRTCSSGAGATTPTVTTAPSSSRRSGGASGSCRSSARRVTRSTTAASNSSRRTCRPSTRRL